MKLVSNLSGAVLCGGAVIAFSRIQTPKPQTGEQLYAKQCARCHGAKGEGGKGYSLPLRGTLSVADLGKFIKQSMPPGPKHCPSADAEKVAAFMHAAFYSPVAQERNRPPRIALQRLTVRQFRNAISDLVGGYHPAIPGVPAGGLRGRYYKGQQTGDGDKVVERTDSQVKFDFGSDGPVPGKFDPHKFTIVWDGSLLAPDTGEYELQIDTPQSARVWLNHMEKPLIDAWVKSANETSNSATVYLVGGRSYPIRIDFSKSTTGVNDADKLKGKPAGKASITFQWRRPNHAMEPIPAHCLFNVWSFPSFVAEAPMPPDDRSIGFERGNTVSKAWDEAVTAASLETAGYVATNIGTLASVGDDDPKRRDKIIKYCHDFVEHAFSRPLTLEVEKLYVTKQFDTAPSLESAIKRVVLLALKSPRFLYRSADESASDGYTVASNLSYALWDTLPSPDQIHAVEQNRLQTPEQIRAEADRMAQDPRAWAKLRDFLLRWLKVDEVPEITKNPATYPGFDAAVASDLRTSLELFLQKTAWSEASDYRDLILGQNEYLNGRLAKLYGQSLAPDAEFTEVNGSAESRVGVMTQPYLLSRFAYRDTTSPIHRGVLILRNLLGRNLQPPPAAFAPLAPSLHPTWTTRERVTAQTKPAACIGCHGQINPLGFTLEKYDAIGRLRTVENGKPVDSTGFYIDRKGAKVTFKDAQELANYIANNEDGQKAFIEKLFHHLVKQPVLAYGPNTLNELHKDFVESRYSIRKLMASIAALTAIPPKGPQK